MPRLQRDLGLMSIISMTTSLMHVISTRDRAPSRGCLLQPVGLGSINLKSLRDNSPPNKPPLTTGVCCIARGSSEHLATHWSLSDLIFGPCVDRDRQILSSNALRFSNRITHGLNPLMPLATETLELSSFCRGETIK